MKQLSLEGKTALLTGGLGTLGSAQASALLGAGAQLIVLDRAEQGLAQLHRNNPDAQGRIHYVACDLGQLDETATICRQLVEKHQGIDVLINNAALIINRPFEEFSISEYEEQIRVNSSAAFVLVQECAPAMKKKKYGKIINLTSVTLNGCLNGYVPYVASKGALLGLTKSLAREMGAYGVRVNAISPGAVVSEAEQRVFADRLAEYNNWVLEHQSLKVRIQADDIAQLTLFLSAPASDMITGQIINIDGGW